MIDARYVVFLACIYIQGGMKSSALIEITPCVSIPGLHDGLFCLAREKRHDRSRSRYTPKEESPVELLNGKEVCVTRGMRDVSAREGQQYGCRLCISYMSHFVFSQM